MPPCASHHLRIDLDRQQLTLLTGEQTLASWPVSTARNGPGEQIGSGCTPRGHHRIRLRIGANAPANTVFIGRRPSGEIWTPELAHRHPERDWILTRILWLTGSEPGRNRGGQCDTLRRFIYIHGTPDDQPMGTPGSHGCIRMHNHHLIELFEQVSNGTPVEIVCGNTAPAKASR